MVSEPFSAYFFMKQSCLTLIQFHHFDNGFELPVLCLIIAGQAVAAGQLKCFINNRYAGLIVERLRTTECSCRGAVRQTVSRICLPYCNSIFGGKLVSRSEGSAEIGRFTGPALE